MITSFEDFKNFCISYKDIKVKYFLKFNRRISFLEDLIDEVENLTYYNILYLRFIEYRTLKYISKCLGYSYRHTQRLYSNSLLELYRIYQQKYTTNK